MGYFILAFGLLTLSSIGQAMSPSADERREYSLLFLRAAWGGVAVVSGAITWGLVWLAK